MEKPRLLYPVIVEGKYDKIKLDSLFCADIFITDGFGIFHDREKQALFRLLSARTPLLLAADPDGAGKLIRRWFAQSLPTASVYPVYLPQIPGKERRKASPSKEGYLGLEGVDADIPRQAFAPWLSHGEAFAPKNELQKRDLILSGLSGGKDSREKRRALCRLLGLPEDLTTPALLRVLNLLYTKEEFLTFLEKLA